ncbi:dihydrofolate reductase family protein [Lunatibacter salilacus]|uniref:dihydrofolate reductase family protein n=1 Tax=Lunatibacter salilacus TaxID=2483804 RepID=UPI001F29DD25|nr:dihydrofolate reductase family protein [Lunatibacter salilacus]
MTTFLFLTLNGFYKGLNNDISWHNHGEEGNAYSERQLEAGNIFLFGRRTYEMMYSFWPTRMAYDQFPKVAEGMNSAEKCVISNSLKTADWNNSKIISRDAVHQIIQHKQSSGKNITILGSGSVITQLTEERMIDEYQLLIDPTAIGKGTPLFENISQRLDLELIDSNVFKNSGSVLLTYKTI